MRVGLATSMGIICERKDVAAYRDCGSSFLRRFILCAQTKQTDAKPTGASRKPRPTLPRLPLASQSMRITPIDVSFACQDYYGR